MMKINIEDISKFYKEDYKKKLEEKINDEKKVIKYLKLMIKYFEKNNITTYENFDKRHFQKIEEYLKKNKFLYYNNCCDNIGFYYKKDDNYKNIILYVNNKNMYNCEINISYKHYISEEIEYYNVLEQCKNKLEYVEENLKQDEKLYKNFEKYIEKYNKKVKELYDIVYSKSHLNNIIDIFIYCSKNE